MSKFAQFETQFTDPKFLVLALKDLGYQAEEHLENPVNLFGYHGDWRPEVAHLVIPRKQVGGSSNDIGFVKKDGVYQAIISEFDQLRHGRAWMNKLAQQYTVHKTMAFARKNNYRYLSQKVVDGKIQIQLAVR